MSNQQIFLSKLSLNCPQINSSFTYCPILFHLFSLAFGGVNRAFVRYNLLAMPQPNLANRSLHSAKKAKKDEFYTQLSDIENELKHYRSHFKDKLVYCNCDDPRVSNFFHYFSFNFEDLGLKKLLTTCYQNQSRDLFSQHESENAIYLAYKGDINQNKIPDIDEIGVETLNGDGDFRSPESIALLQQADIVVTNPPFSLFREYVAQLVEYQKKFVIIGNKNAVTYQEIFPLIKQNKIWVGNTPMSTDMMFDVNNEFAQELVCVFTNDNKMSQIESNEYLKNGFQTLSNLDGKLLIIGSSLDDNDIHVVNHINMSNIDEIYYSSSNQTAKDDKSKLSSLFSKKKITLFDRESISYD